jgi:hypothetical protein
MAELFFAYSLFWCQLCILVVSGRMMMNDVSYGRILMKETVAARHNSE